jgi:gliding motility-associated-like protein
LSVIKIIQRHIDFKQTGTSFAAKKLLLLIGVLFIAFQAQSAHIVGGEMLYTYTGTSNGNVNYTITMNLFVDCKSTNTNAIEQDKTAFFNVFRVNATNYTRYNSYTLNNSRTGPFRVSDNSYKCIKNVPNVCVDKYVYTMNLSLPANNLGYVVSFERCCRNSTTTNILNPGTTGATYWTKIPGSALVSKDNSPKFKFTPPTFICLNAPLTFDHSATDADGDSLVYELFTPFTGASSTSPIPSGNAATNPINFKNVSWSSANGYAPNNQIDGNPTLSINRKTGKLTLTPTVAGQFVIGIKVLEYRNGVLIGETKRDVQFNAIICVFEVVSAFYTPSVACSETELNISNFSQGGTSFSWDFGVVSTASDTSNVKSPKYKYDSAGNYSVRLVARTSVCADTFYNEVIVKPNFDVILPNDTLYCGPFQTTLSSNFKNKQKLWNTGDTGISINVSKAGVYWLKVSDDPCVAVDSVVFQNDLSKVDLGPDTVICADDFAPFYHQGPSNYKTYNWGNGHVSDTLYISTPGKYILEVSNTNNCFSKDTIDFIEYPPPMFDLRDTLFCRNTSVLLNALNTDLSTQAESKYLWSNGASSASISVGVEGKYSVWVSNKYCNHFDSATLTFINTGLELGPDTFYCGPILRTVRAQTFFKSYQWQDASSLDYTVAQTAGKYKLTIVSVDGCIESDSMAIFQFPVLDPGLGNDTQICISSFIDLNAISGMNSYLWNTGETSQAIRSYNKGKFTVLVKNAIGCIAQDSINVTSNPDAVPNELFMPDAFTPNEDGVNDFFPENKYSNLSSPYNLKIYNRWGEQIYECEASNINWNGFNKNQLAPQDVYVFLVRYTGCDGKERTIRGTFNLLR